MSYTPHSADSIRLFRAESSIPARNDQPYAADTQETVGFFRVKIPGKNHRVSSASTTRTKSSGFFLVLEKHREISALRKNPHNNNQGFPRSADMQEAVGLSGMFRLFSEDKVE